MVKVYKITEEQKEILKGREYMPNCFFNPCIDKNGNYFISIEEVNLCDNPEFNFIKSLELINFEPIIENGF